MLYYKYKYMNAKWPTQYFLNFIHYNVNSEQVILALSVVVLVSI